MATQAAASTVPSTTTADNVPAELPWHAALPAPRSTPSKMTCDELAQWIRGQDGQNKKEWLVVDVRRTDFEVSVEFQRRQAERPSAPAHGPRIF